MKKKKSLAGEQKENMTKELKAHESATRSPKPTGTTQPNRFEKIPSRFEEIPVYRQDLEGLVQVTDALQAIEVLLSYVGNRGQDGGDDGASAAWTAIGLASAVSIASAHIKNFQDLALRPAAEKEYQWLLPNAEAARRARRAKHKPAGTE